MKVCVYTVAKNEECFAERWYDSMCEADYVLCMDTGSTDNTAEILADMGGIVHKRKIEPWRFDNARNAVLELVPHDTDICVKADLDEYFISGWRDILESKWQKDTTRARYRYVWKINPDGSDGVVFLADNIHKYGTHKWLYPTHEILTRTDGGTDKFITAEDVILKHTPRFRASRDSDLELLKTAVSEHPESDRCAHYLGRQYMFAGQYENAIHELLRHLSLKTAVWRAERACSLRYIGVCYEKLGDYDTAFTYYRMSFNEYPVRDALYEAERLAYELHDWKKCVYYGEKLFEIKKRDISYISYGDAWSQKPLDMLNVARAIQGTGDN